jgi:uncharacterized phage protein (TIGR01671 family)
METIKFRGLRTDGKGWVYGVPYFIKEERACFIINNCQTLNFTNKDTTFNGVGVDCKTVGQYVGLKDKKGKEIYKGDIIKDCITSALIEVKYGFNKNNAYNGWYGKYIDIEVKDVAINGDYGSNQNNNIEIIGNIHENK